MKNVSRPIILIILNETTKQKLSKLKLFRYIKKFIKKSFRVIEYFNEKLILNFDSTINNNKDLKRIKLFIYEFDCRFKIIKNNQIEIIY